MGSEIDGDLYRKVLGRYPTGVTLVTGMDGDEPLAMVIGSFVSVSMDPPLVGFLPARALTRGHGSRSAGRSASTCYPTPRRTSPTPFFRKDGDPWEEKGLGARSFWVSSYSVMSGLNRLRDSRCGRCR
ncbi:MAG: hypothetical protein Ct9H300mP31_08820 [Acidimicrobiaceae bacterium]|nr:MAG: hypothetical protein Ct9H300mP31_08820 [Acidimicrobiaceae bacterium]